MRQDAASAFIKTIFVANPKKIKEVKVEAASCRFPRALSITDNVNTIPQF